MLGFCAVDDTLVPVFGVMKEVRVQFSMTYGIADFEYVLHALDAGATELRTMITETASFDALPDLFDSLRGSTSHCKVQIDPRRT